MQNFLDIEEHYSLVSSDLPLIYNLNMIENISLIKEVHEFMPRVKAQKIGSDLLSTVGLSEIELYRVNQCSIDEIFYIMFMRALMSNETDIFIEVKHSIVESFNDIESIMKNMNLLKGNKNVFILDLLENEADYKGSICNIIK